jgi:hypothetical protein
MGSMQCNVEFGYQLLFKTQLISIGCPYLTGNSLSLCYDPNRLMLSIGLWRLYINITIRIVNFIHRPVFCLKHNVSETGSCPRLQMVPTELGSIDGPSPCLRTMVQNRDSGGLLWIHNEPCNSKNDDLFLCSWATVSFCIRTQCPYRCSVRAAVKNDQEPSSVNTQAKSNGLWL